MEKARETAVVMFSLKNMVVIWKSAAIWWISKLLIMLTNDQNGTIKHIHTNMECIDYKRTIEGYGEQWRHIGGDMVAPRLQEFVRNWHILNQS